MKRLLLIALATLALSGCGGIEPDAQPQEQTYENMNLQHTRYSSSLARFIDTEAGIVCYTWSRGIDCLPISETKLDD